MRRPSIFISYSHKDEIWKQRLLLHLSILEEGGFLEVWSDRQINAGDDWLASIEKAIESAHIAILLISEHFLTSRFILDFEIPRILARRSKDGVRIFPVIVRSCPWETVHWLKGIQVRPINAKPLASRRGDGVNIECKAIAKEIFSLLDAISEENRTDERVLDSVVEHALLSLHQLPVTPSDFTGRETELASMKAAIENNRSAILCIRGIGGIGKTALALKLADDTSASYAEAQIYLDLKGVSPEPLTSFQAMLHVIRAFHPQTQPPQDEAELTNIYRSLLYGKQTILLMDNAFSAAQVSPLVPPHGNLLLITSRNRFTIPGMTAKDLDVLPHTEACFFLLGISSRIGPVADVIAHLCGGLPFGLRLAGNAISERPDLSPVRYARQLSEAKERQGLIEGSLTLSYQLLHSKLAQLWAVLSIFPKTFDAEAAAATWGLERLPAEEALGELIRVSLVEGNNGRYQLHDLARVFAESRLNEGERFVAQRRHAGYFLTVLARADDLFMTGDKSTFQGLRLFDLEWNNIRAGQAWSAIHANQDEAAANFCESYPNAGFYCLSLRIHPLEGIAWIEAALFWARHHGNLNIEATYLGSLGQAYGRLADTQKAITFFEMQLGLFRELGDKNGQSQALGSLGVSYANLGQHRRTISIFQETILVARELGNWRHEISGLLNLGAAHIRLGEFREAVTSSEEALRVARERKDLIQESYALGNIAVSYRNLGEHAKALGIFEEVLGLARETGDRRSESKALAGIANSHISLDEPQHAESFFEQELTIARAIGDRSGEALTLSNLGALQLVLLNFSNATDLCMQSLNIAREIGDRSSEGFASLNLSEIAEKEGDLASAVMWMQVAVEILRDVGHADLEKKASKLDELRSRSREGGACQK